MHRGAFGVIPLGRSARFIDGQQWLQGSAAELARLPYDSISTRFPLLSDCQSRLAPDWKNRDGVIHVRQLRNDGEVVWFVVHCFQPDYSIARSLPLWLCIVMSQAEFEQGLGLESAMQELCTARESIDSDPESLLRWIDRKDEYERREPGLAELRVAHGMFDRWGVQPVQEAPPVSDIGFWRGIQLLLEAHCRFASEGAASARWMAIRFEPSGEVRDEARGGACPLVFTIGQYAPLVAGAFTARGVSDEVLQKRLGARVIASTAMEKRKSGLNAPFPELIDVPIEMIDLDWVRDDEFDEWSRQQWMKGQDAVLDACCRLVDRFRKDPGGQGRVARRLARILLKAPGGSDWNGERMLGVVQQALAAR